MHPKKQAYGECSLWGALTVLHSEGWNDTEVLLKNAQGMHHATAWVLCALLEAQGIQSGVQVLLGHASGQKSQCLYM